MSESKRFIMIHISCMHLALNSTFLFHLTYIPSSVCPLYPFVQLMQIDVTRGEYPWTPFQLVCIHLNFHVYVSLNEPISHIVSCCLFYSIVRSVNHLFIHISSALRKTASHRLAILALFPPLFSRLAILALFPPLFSHYSSPHFLIKMIPLCVCVCVCVMRFEQLKRVDVTREEYLWILIHLVSIPPSLYNH